MKFAYRFSNLLGAVYRHGNLSFSKDGNSVISPVGNRISVFDLKNNKSETLPVSTAKNITCVGLSPDGNLAILVDEDGAALLVSLITRAVLHHFHFHKPVASIRFSPDGRKFVVTKENVALMYHAPGRNREFNAFVLDKSYYGPYDETTCIDWTDDSKCFVVGSKDMSTWVFGAERWSNLIYYSLGGHKDIMVGCFFEKDSLDLYTVSQDGTLCVWESDTELDGLLLRKTRLPAERGEEERGEGEEEEPRGEVIRGKGERPKEKEGTKNVRYKQRSKHFFNKEGDFNNLTAAAFHKPTHILVTGFASGIFHLHELPEFNLIHSLSISDQRIATVSMNSSGDWIGFGCSGLGQLLVWEWQSESYVFKQQGHFNNMAALAYSPDGQYIATGGDDGKVKVWNMTSGLCFVTFTEHTSSVTNVTFTSRGFVIVSASLDGTVRAFDLHRYRNFRTFTSPRPTQFSSLAVDPSGDLVSAGAQDSFEVFIWSMQTGRLLEVLGGHEGPVSCLCFSPVQSILASASWDKTVRLWDMMDSWQTTETLRLTSDGLAVSYRPDGQELAVATLDGEISFWNPQSANQTGSVSGRHDLEMGRKETDKITSKQSAKGKSFTSLCYSADGESILAGGQSKFVCIYNIREQILMKKFEISCNLSLDAMEEFLDRRKMTEFGSLALVDEGVGDGDGVELSLPGVRKGDMSSRHFKPEIRVSSIRFSPTGRSWAATSTEGLLTYSLDGALVFDPYDLDLDVTPASVRRQLRQAEWATAIVLAFRLNETALTQEVLEAVPHHQIAVVCGSLPDVYVEKLLGFIAAALERCGHLQFYLSWSQSLLTQHGQKLKTRSGAVLPTIQSLQKSIQKHFEDLSKLCDWNMYTIRYAVALSKQRGVKRTAGDALCDEDSEVMSEASLEETDMLM
ncbi:Periodic tryptophan protein 2 homolog [Salmo salar]|uniref:Periodic tryptophan protein 2 homolog n=1 Tax=Salmo salar TaxID=8030 RepID=C0H9I6_SALSA|nr:Periodic tryptophan protein 2 homolog [Salmo salar]ACN10705.1 Periodic tryptophan protein 2 homolog [Salmo salar]|eukprot:NP_001167056.1 Periodic tryptophan protein 2 homolog [Salmo salar]